MGGSYNHITLVGRLVRDPQGKVVSDGVDLARFVIAVDRPYKKEGEERQADFIPVVAWRKLGEICNEYLGKGRLVLVDGRLQIRSYELEGKTVWQPEVVASGVQMLDWRAKSAADGSEKVSAEKAPEDSAGQAKSPGRRKKSSEKIPAASETAI